MLRKKEIITASAIRKVNCKSVRSIVSNSAKNWLILIQPSTLFVDTTLALGSLKLDTPGLSE